MKNRMLRAVLALCAIALAGPAFAEGQALSANGGSSGTEPARIGSGNQLPDAVLPSLRTAAVSGARTIGRLPTDGAGDPASR